MKSKLQSALSRVTPFLRRVFLHNWGAKLISLVFAIILWNYAVLTLGTTRNVVVPEVPVTVTNSAILRQRGLALSRTVEELVQDVRVTVSTPLSNAALVSASAINVNCDLSSVSMPGRHTLTLYGRSSTGSVVSVYPSTVTVDVETLSTRELPLQVVTSGKARENCIPGEATLSSTAITVTGPQALLQTIERAVVKVDLSGVQDTLRKSCAVELLDASGKTLQSELITLSQRDVTVQIPVRQTQTFDLLVEDCLIGADALAPGYVISSIEIFPESLRVEGSAKAIASLQEAGGLSLSEIDLTGASGDIRSYPTVYLPADATLPENRTILVMIRIEREMMTLALQNVPIQVRNVPEGLRAQLNQGSLTVTLTGPKDLLKDLPQDHVQLYVDAFNRSEGTFSAPVKILLDESYESQATLSSPSVSVTLRGIEPEA